MINFYNLMFAKSKIFIKLITNKNLINYREIRQWLKIRKKNTYNVKAQFENKNQIKNYQKLLQYLENNKLF